ncbi:MAG: hypothetical protein JXB48_21195 [Candidatus Latescibacteria bacterium]|nr:hypothetical protein [Candidatus Latescibacterota bacterium]
MGAELATLGTYPKRDKKNKVYYVNRLDYGFSVRVYGDDGKPKQKKNSVTGLPITNSIGEPEFVEQSVMFMRWQPRFSEIGYWCIYEVTPETPKSISDELERMAKSKDHQVMTEKAFIEHTNPALARHISETSDLEIEKQMLSEDVEKAKKEKNKLEDEIARLKQKAGVR